MSLYKSTTIGGKKQPGSKNLSPVGWGGGGRGMMRYPHWSMGPCGAHHTSETQLFPLEGARAVNI
jgi:hypothetical protein